MMTYLLALKLKDFLVNSRSLTQILENILGVTLLGWMACLFASFALSFAGLRRPKRRIYDM